LYELFFILILFKEYFLALNLYEQFLIYAFIQLLEPITYQLILLVLMAYLIFFFYNIGLFLINLRHYKIIILSQVYHFIKMINIILQFDLIYLIYLINQFLQILIILIFLV